MLRLWDNPIYVTYTWGVPSGSTDGGTSTISQVKTMVNNTVGQIKKQCQRHNLAVTGIRGLPDQHMSGISLL